MDDSTPESDRSFGDLPSEPFDQAVERITTGHAAWLHRSLTILTVDQDDDGWTLAFRYLTAAEADRLIRLSNRVRPIGRSGLRALHRLRATGEARAPRGGQP